MSVEFAYEGHGWVRFEDMYHGGSSLRVEASKVSCIYPEYQGPNEAPMTLMVCDGLPFVLLATPDEVWDIVRAALIDADADTQWSRKSGE